jgi:hypothetical protein
MRPRACSGSVPVSSKRSPADAPATSSATGRSCNPTAALLDPRGLGGVARPPRGVREGRGPAAPADSPMPSVCLRTVNICGADDAGNRRSLSLIGTRPPARGSQHASLPQPRKCGSPAGAEMSRADSCSDRFAAVSNGSPAVPSGTSRARLSDLDQGTSLMATVAAFGFRSEFGSLRRC